MKLLLAICRSLFLSFSHLAFLIGNFVLGTGLEWIETCIRLAEC